MTSNSIPGFPAHLRGGPLRSWQKRSEFSMPSRKLVMISQRVAIFMARAHRLLFASWMLMKEHRARHNRLLTRKKSKPTRNMVVVAPSRSCCK